MDNWWWSWLLMVVGVTSLILAGRGYWWAWLIGLVSEALWIWYAIDTKQWGFIPFALVYAAVYIINATTWAKKGT